MFTGIVKYQGHITSISEEGSNKTFELEAPFDEAIHEDQSIAHNGVCLTVTQVSQDGAQATYKVTAVDETLKKTNLGSWGIGDRVNLELCMAAGARLDGHFVQGHVDGVGIVEEVKDVDGSWMYRFGFDPQYTHLLVDKGSVTINGVSLTVVEAGENYFTVTIIPYTYEHTNFHRLKVGDKVNLEFDILGKYISKLMAGRK
ncbi:MAG: riboflavin synthase [Bacteroidia bacterium]|nr:riboflavin synthase [Bacteroidia bacterium]